MILTGKGISKFVVYMDMVLFIFRSIQCSLIITFLFLLWPISSAVCFVKFSCATVTMSIMEAGADHQGDDY